jgi:hypothetical protein
MDSSISVLTRIVEIYIGAMYTFLRYENQWSQTSKIAPKDGASSDWFGNNIALDNDHLIASSEQDDDRASLTGMK